MNHKIGSAIVLQCLKCGQNLEGTHRNGLAEVAFERCTETTIAIPARAERRRAMKGRI